MNNNQNNHSLYKIEICHIMKMIKKIYKTNKNKIYLKLHNQLKIPVLQRQVKVNSINLKE